MNAKKAKILRRLVKSIAKSENPLEPVSYVEDLKSRTYVEVEKVSGDGKSTYTDQELLSVGTIKLNKTSAKGVYRTLKNKINNVK